MRHATSRAPRPRSPDGAPAESGIEGDWIKEAGPGFRYIPSGLPMAPSPEESR